MSASDTISRFGDVPVGTWFKAVPDADGYGLVFPVRKIARTTLPDGSVATAQRGHVLFYFAEGDLVSVVAAKT